MGLDLINSRRDSCITKKRVDLVASKIANPDRADFAGCRNELFQRGPSIGDGDVGELDSFCGRVDGRESCVGMGE